VAAPNSRHSFNQTARINGQRPSAARAREQTRAKNKDGRSVARKIGE